MGTTHPRACRRFTLCTLAAGLLALLSALPGWAQTSVWLGGSGNWYDADDFSVCENWSTCTPTGGTPGIGGNTNNVVIPAGSNVAMNGGGTILNLTLAAGDTLAGVNGGYADFNAACGACALSNSGTITLGADSYFSIGASSLTLSGSGTVTLLTSSSSIASDPGANARFINQQLIQGQGQIGLGETAITNEGTINANVAGASLTVQGNASALMNTGTLEASKGATLFIVQSGGALLANAGGTIVAESGSTVVNDAGMLTGGLLTTSGSGVILSGNNPVLDNLTNAGSYVLPVSTSTTLEGAINNTGSIAIGSASGNATLYVNGAVTLTGGGTITLVNSGVFDSALSSLAPGAQLTNEETIEGAGVIGDSGLTIVNAGSIVANQPNPLALGEGALTNTGLVEATSGATLGIYSQTFDNAGTLDVAAGSTIDFDSTYHLTNYDGATNTLTGGAYIIAGTLQFTDAANGLVAVDTNAASITLNGAGSQLLDALGNSVLANLSANSAAGSFTIENGRNFTTAGSFLNAGTVTVGNGSALDVGPGGTGAYTQSGVSSLTDIQTGGELSAAVINFEGGHLNVNGILDPLSLAICGSCTLGGNGTVSANVTNAGTVAPGPTAGTPGTLTLTGNYAQSAIGTLLIDLAGAAAGDYSVLKVAGATTLDGGVDFVAVDGFAPAAGDDFTFLEFGSESGDFSSVDLSGWSCPSGDTCTEVLTSDSLSLDVSGPSVGPPPQAVPEPPTWLLEGFGLGALIVHRRLRRAHLRELEPLSTFPLSCQHIRLESLEGRMVLHCTRGIPERHPASPTDRPRQRDKKKAAWRRTLKALSRSCSGRGTAGMRLPSSD